MGIPLHCINTIHTSCCDVLCRHPEYITKNEKTQCVECKTWREGNVNVPSRTFRNVNVCPACCVSCQECKGPMLQRDETCGDCFKERECKKRKREKEIEEKMKEQIEKESQERKRIEKKQRNEEIKRQEDELKLQIQNTIKNNIKKIHFYSFCKTEKHHMSKNYKHGTVKLDYKHNNFDVDIAIFNKKNEMKVVINLDNAISDYGDDILKEIGREGNIWNISIQDGIGIMKNCSEEKIDVHTDREYYDEKNCKEECIFDEYRNKNKKLPCKICKKWKYNCIELSIPKKWIEKIRNYTSKEFICGTCCKYCPDCGGPWGGEYRRCYPCNKKSIL